MSQDALFDGFDPVVPVPDEPLSATQRVTLRNRTALELGKHPANGLPLDPDPDHRCGNCASFNRYAYHGRVYNKCPHHRLGESHSAASDMRAGWPACPHWNAHEPSSP